MLAIGRALVTNPRLLILDEATEGLAPLVRAEIWRCLAIAQGVGPGHPRHRQERGGAQPDRRPPLRDREGARRVDGRLPRPAGGRRRPAPLPRREPGQPPGGAPAMNVRPFRAYRYAGPERDLGRIVAPPYDQVSPELRARLAAPEPGELHPLLAAGGGDPGATATSRRAGRWRAGSPRGRGRGTRCPPSTRTRRRTGPAAGRSRDRRHRPRRGGRVRPRRRAAPRADARRAEARPPPAAGGDRGRHRAPVHARPRSRRRDHPPRGDG